MARKKKDIEEVADNKTEDVIDSVESAEPMESEEFIVNETASVEEESPITEEKNVSPVRKARVVNCKRLFVRSKADPNSDYIRIVSEGDILDVNIADSTDLFYRVSGDGFSGYCMKDYIELN